MKHNVFFHIALFALAIAFLPSSIASAEEQTNQGPAHVGIEQRREEFRESVMGTENSAESAPETQIEPAAGDAPAAEEAPAAAATQEQPESTQAQEQPAEPAADETK